MKTRKSSMLMITTVLMSASPAFALQIPVDLSDWQSEGGSSNWNLQVGNNSVLQTVNGAPTIFYDQNTLATQGTALSGTIEVQTTGDDDFIGFVLGYQPGSIFSESADFFLVDWKQGTQAGWDEGLAISYVRDGSNGNTGRTVGSYWQHTDGEVELITRATNQGATGWADNQVYEFGLTFTDSLIEIVLDGLTEISITPADVGGLSSFSDGAFGFYNYSQGNVLYAGITEAELPPDDDDNGNGGDDPTPVPIASPLGLIGLGMVAMGLLRRGHRRMPALRNR